MRPALLALAALALFACRSPLPAPTRPAVGAEQVARWVEDLEATAEARRSMRGVLRLSVDAPDLSLRGSQRVAAKRPSWLRVEILALFGQVAAVLTTDGRVYQLREAGAPRRQSGPVPPGLLWDVARVDLEPPDAVALLLGGVRPWPRGVLGAVRAEEPGVVSVPVFDGEGRLRQRLHFDGEGRLVALVRHDGVGPPLFEARFSEYVEQVGGPFAERLDLRFPRSGARAEVSFRGVELNPELPAALFSVGGGPTEAGRGPVAPEGAG